MATASFNGQVIAESDETLMEAFLDAGTLDDVQLRQGLIQAVAKGAFYPVVCCSATNLAGIEALAETLAWLTPAPSERGSRRRTRIASPAVKN